MKYQTILVMTAASAQEFPELHDPSQCGTNGELNEDCCASREN